MRITYIVSVILLANVSHALLPRLRNAFGKITGKIAGNGIGIGNKLVDVGKIVTKPVDKVKGGIKEVVNGIGDNLPYVPFLNDRKLCFDDLGCFGNKDFYDVVQRPISFLPSTPEKLDVVYHLFTNKNPFRPVKFRYNSTAADITGSPFDGKKLTKVVIHGFRDNFDDMAWMGDLKDLILKYNPLKYNIITVDWSKGAQKQATIPNYNLAVANTRVVGAMTAHFLKTVMSSTDANPADFHLIGHSLGAQTCGYIGERFNTTKIGHITGLDAAGPDFRLKNIRARLDPTDATIVDAIHTNYGDNIVEGFGIEWQVGHYDYYPNGGYKQPGCEVTRGVSKVLVEGVGPGIGDTIGCNHHRAVELIPTDYEMFGECQPVAYSCDNYDDFKEGKCGYCGEDNEQCELMPLFVDHWDATSGQMHTHELHAKRMFVDTSLSTPFCLYHYQVIVHVSKTSKRSSGSIKVDLKGERRDVDSVVLKRTLTAFAPGKSYTYLLTYPKPLGPVLSVNTHWDVSGITDLNILKRNPPIAINEIHVNYMSNLDHKNANSTRLCPQVTNVIEDEGYATFTLCNDSAR